MIHQSTGGHSAAASHGNFYATDSYTARMQELVQDLFKDVGITFVGRNYAMGGTSAAVGLISFIAQMNFLFDRTDALCCFL
jgi:hypothetical protein